MTKRLFIFVLFFFAGTSGLLNAQVLQSNEIHYDNTGADTGERIEVVGAAGFNLSGYSIYFYTDNGTSYANAALSGTLPSSCTVSGNNLGVYVMDVVAATGVAFQNGASDGWALVNGSTVLEFFSYEGIITGTAGPANGMTSIDIGASEPSSAPVGSSIQRNADNTWTYGPGTNTFGGCNTSQIIPMPVTLINFTGKRFGDEVILRWATATEKNNDYFAVERSGDGKNFIQIHETKGAGNSQETREYTFSDEAPLKGMNYYRLKQVDFDGQFTYSTVVLVQMDPEKLTKVFPNPLRTGSQATVFYSARRETTLQIQVIDNLGKIQKSFEQTVQKGDNQFGIDLAGLAHGYYRVQITDGIDDVRYVNLIIR